MKSPKINNIIQFSKRILKNSIWVILILIALKLLFQLIIFQSGYRWLSADDYCRTVKSFEWLQKPVINSGVWLTPHFWLNGLFMLFIKNIIFAAALVNIFFSVMTLVFFYKLSEIIFDKKTAIIASLIFIFFPFQVWLSMSGLPESIFIFFIISGLYYLILWEKNDLKIRYLLVSSILIGLSNVFRYEGWIFSLVLVLLVIYRVIRLKTFNKKAVIYILISAISFLTIFWWLIQNYIDYKDIFFFARETSKIYESYSTSKFLQIFIQYPVFIFYIAPITTLFAIKIIWTTLRNRNNRILRVFIMFNIFELLLLMIQGLLGTGGTNMISRYIVVNAILFIPISVYQIFYFRKYLTVILFFAIIIINIVWSFYYPQPFREDTFEIGYFLRRQINNASFKADEKIYFEELEGFYDTFAVESLSNDPSKFILGNLPTVISTIEKPKKKKSTKLSDEEINILDIRNYFQKNKINLAVVKSDGYSEKLNKMNFRTEEIGDYKIYYIKDFESNVNDSSITLFAKNVTEIDSSSELVNFGNLLAIKGYKIDNTNFGVNPQTITFDFYSINKNIIDSIDYDNLEFDRYRSVIEIRTVETDSVVYTDNKKIFSDKNIEDLLAVNNIRQIIVLKPFALLYYTNKFRASEFESGVYNLDLKIRDTKYDRDLTLFKGVNVFKPDSLENRQKSDTLKTKQDSVKSKQADSLKSKSKYNPAPKKDSIFYNYNIGSIVAVFPDANYDMLIKKSSVDVYKLLLQNGIKVFFSQRYQGDHFLNWVFTYF